MGSLIKCILKPSDSYLLHVSFYVGTSLCNLSFTDPNGKFSFHIRSKPYLKSEVLAVCSLNLIYKVGSVVLQYQSGTSQLLN